MAGTFFLVSLVGMLINATTVIHQISGNSSLKSRTQGPKFKIMPAYANGLQINIISHENIAKTCLSIKIGIGLYDSPLENPDLIRFYIAYVLERSTKIIGSEFVRLLRNFQVMSDDSFYDLDLEYYYATFLYTDCHFSSEATDFISKLCGAVFPNQEELQEEYDRFVAANDTFSKVHNNKINRYVLLPCVARFGSIFQSFLFDRKKSINRITLKDIENIKKKYFIRENMIVTYFTSLQYQEALDQVSKRFQNLPNAKDSENKEPKEDTAVNFIDEMQEKYKGKIVLFKNTQILEDSHFVKRLYLQIPLPLTEDYYQRGMYKCVTYKLCNDLAEKILQALRNSDLASDVHLSFDILTQSTSFLGVEISLTPLGYERANDVICLFVSIFRVIKEMFFRDASVFAEQCYAFTETPFNGSLNKIIDKTNYSGNNENADYYTYRIICELLEQSEFGVFFNNAKVTSSDRELLKHNISSDFMETVFEHLCDSKNWLVFLTSTDENLKKQHQIVSRVKIGTREIESLSEESKKKLEEIVKKCFPYCEDRALFVDKFESDKTRKNALFGSVSKKAALGASFNGFILAQKEARKNIKSNKSESLAVKAERMAAFEDRKHIIIGRCGVQGILALDYKIRKDDLNIPASIKLILDFTQMLSDREIARSMLAFYVIFSKLTAKYDIYIAQNLLEFPVLDIKFSQAILKIAGIEKNVLSFYEEFLGLMKAFKTPNGQMISENEFINAKQHILNMMDSLFNGPEKINILYYLITKGGLYCNEIHYLKSVTKLRKDEVKMCPNIQLALSCENILATDKLVQLCEEGIAAFEMESNPSTNPAIKTRMMQLEEFKELEIRFENSTKNYVFLLIPIPELLHHRATVFVKIFKPLFERKYRIQEQKASQALMELFKDKASGKTYLVLSAESHLKCNAIKKYLKGFIKHCQQLSSYVYHSVLLKRANHAKLNIWLHKKKNGRLYSKYITAILVRHFIASIAQRENYLYVYSQAVLE
ncbi:hypothetical protein ENBRE01_2713 [Enteropsectra breve]|nr:hypothetical protein ENBRE01_2713 [Enteropsectra breve]